MGNVLPGIIQWESCTLACQGHSCLSKAQSNLKKSVRCKYQKGIQKIQTHGISLLFRRGDGIKNRLNNRFVLFLNVAL